MELVAGPELSALVSLVQVKIEIVGGPETGALPTLTQLELEKFNNWDMT
jgi:hypothetical protein